MKASSIVLLGGGRPKPTPPPLIKRPPLGPFLQPVTYSTVLPFMPPVGTDLYFYRGNFCGLRVAGAPAVPGSNPSNPECVMAALLDNYPDWVVDEFLRLYAGYGYTHLQRSLGHVLYYSTIERFIAITQKAQAIGLFADVWFIANEFPGFQFNQDVSFWKPKLDPYIDRLLGEGCIDFACPSWQMDQVMEGAPGNATISIIAYVADRLPPTVPIFTHWMNEALAWWKTGGEVWTDRFGSTLVMDRFTWWFAMQPYLSGGHHQGSNAMAINDPKTYQDKLCDTLDYFGGDTGKGNMGQSRRNGVRPFILSATEVTAQFQFDDLATEEQGDMAGFLMTCTRSHTGYPMGGYGNGARMPDGSPL